MPEELDPGPAQARAESAAEAVPQTEVRLEAAALPPVPPRPVLEGSGLRSSGEWYFQEQTTGQPAGPWTVAQLCSRWRRNHINGLTPVWREGLDGWVPLAEVQELKQALREARRGIEAAQGKAKAEEDASGRPAKRQKRIVLDEVPLVHTYTSEQGLLYVYDTVDSDWKASDVYEALVQEENAEEEAEEEEDDEAVAEAAVEAAITAAAEAEAKAPAPGATVGGAGATPGAAQVGEGEEPPIDQEKALEELMAVAGAAPITVGTGKASASTAAAKQAPAPAGQVAEPAEAADAEPLTDEKEAKRQKRRDYRERKRLKKQAGLFVKAHDNPNVYVSGLPPDVTAFELEAVMKRAGVLKVDVDSGDAKIRIYTDADGRCKGDALVSYANAASVGLAVEFLNEFELRSQCRICVQQADFEEHDHESKISKQELKELASKTKKDGNRAKLLAAKNAMREAVSWSGEMDDGTGRRIVILRHMFSVEEAEREGKEFYVELADEVKEECEKIGEVAKVTPLERHKQGIVCVKFKSSSEAEECIRVMDGRYFAGRTVEASFYDGKTDLRLLGTVKSTAAPEQQPVPAQQTSAAAADAAPVPAGVARGPEEAAPEPSAAPATALANAAGGAEGPEVSPSAAATCTPAAPGPAAAAASRPEEQAKSWEEWLDGQSSDSDSETRIRTED